MNPTPPPSSMQTQLKLLAGPVRQGSEQQWEVRLADGRLAVLGALLPELAREQSVRRRYVRDVERQRALVAALTNDPGPKGPGIAAIVASGPDPDPRDPAPDPPWRLRIRPEGTTFDQWLIKRAPAPIDEVCALIADIADLLHRVHAHGVVLRDLHPRQIMCTEQQGPMLLDTGLSRVDVLSTRTAASLLLEGSPYASPEQLRHTTLDQRSDLFGLGVLLYRALTGVLPFGDGPALLRQHTTPPPPRSLRAEIPAALERLVLTCLATEPTARPESAAAVASVLRGRGPLQVRDASRIDCQNCGAPLRLGQRLCMSCGREAVVFHHAENNADTSYSIDLVKATEDAAFGERLNTLLSAVSDGPVPSLNLLIGDRRMYSKAELKTRRALPLRLVSGLTHASAQALMARLDAQNFKVRLIHDQSTAMLPRRMKVGLGIAGAMCAAICIGIIAVAPPLVAVIVTTVIACVFTIIGLAAYATHKKRSKQPQLGFVSLRKQPAALPASDPLVAKLAAQLTAETSPDVGEQVGEMALLIQRLVDHRATSSGELEAEFELVTEPVTPLVDLIVRRVQQLAQLDRELASLDEGTIVRALQASEARGEAQAKRHDLLVGLDRLRTLEEHRAATFHQLLEASTLLRRAVELGVSIRDPSSEHRRQLALAQHTLESELSN